MKLKFIGDIDEVVFNLMSNDPGDFIDGVLITLDSLTGVLEVKKNRLRIFYQGINKVICLI